MDLFQHPVFQELCMCLLLVWVFRILRGAPLTWAVLLSWLTFAALSTLGLSWIDDSNALVFLGLCSVACHILIFLDPKSLAGIPVRGSVLAVTVLGSYSCLLWEYHDSGQIPLFVSLVPAVITIFGVALVRAYYLEMAVSEISWTLRLAQVLGLILSSLSVYLCWRPAQGETSTLVWLIAYLLLGYCAAKKESNESIQH